MGKTRLLICMLLLELALLIFQGSIRGEIRKERLLLARAGKSLSAETDSNAYHDELADLYEAEVSNLEAILPRNIIDAAQAFSLTRGKMKIIGITGEVREKSQSPESVILDIEGKGAYVRLSAFLCELKKDGHALRLNELTIDALDKEDVYFTAEVEFLLAKVSSAGGQGE